jgi:hypothetical protein
MNYRISYGNGQCSDYPSYAAAKASFLAMAAYCGVGHMRIQRYMGEGEWASYPGVKGRPTLGG